MRWLIDGYNVCFAVGLIPFQVREGDLRKARGGLLDAIREGLPAADVTATVVVFDAREKLNLPEEPYVAAFAGRVLFASDHPDADGLIEQLLAAESAPERLGVVSSDGRIVKAANRRRARAFSAEAWWDALRDGRLKRVAPVSDERAKPPARPLPAPGDDVDWAQAFAVDESALQAEIDAESGRKPAPPQPGAKSPPAGKATPKPPAVPRKNELPDEWRDFAARLDAGQIDVGDVPGQPPSSAANPFGAGYADDLLADTSWLDQERGPKKKPPGDRN